ncbi:MAG: PilZ domain-containing protein [Candidatus Omnitrophota bacterium]|nr:PilZ domain-containing protein [Candidatus Omnitrophota bacterium]
MDIVPRQKDNIIILYLSGDINIDASNFIEAVGYYLENGITDIMCDFTNVNLVDYSGLSVLAIAYKNASNHQGRMKFINVPLHVKNIFSAVCLDKVFEIYESEELALHSFKEDKVIERIKKKQLRRRFKRLPIFIPLQFKLRHSQDAFHEGKVYNLSAIGAYILCKKIYALGDILTLQIKLMPKPGYITLEGKVIWLAQKELMPQLYPGMGIEFYNISPKLQEQVVQFVERNLSLESAAE